MDMRIAERVASAQMQEWIRRAEREAQLVAARATVSSPETAVRGWQNVFRRRPSFLPYAGPVAGYRGRG